MTETIALETHRRVEFVDITARVQAILTRAAARSGLCSVYVPHTTAGVTVNENADPAVPKDICTALARLAPVSAGYAHQEGNADAHIKATLVGSSVTIPFENQRLRLGTWQAVFFCEFDGPRQRQVIVSVIG